MTDHDIMTIAHRFSARFGTEMNRPDMVSAVAKLLQAERDRHAAYSRFEVQPTDYLAKVRDEARAAHVETFGDVVGNDCVEMAEIMTPRGLLEYMTWKTERGGRVVWDGRYILEGVETPIRKLTGMGLAAKSLSRVRL